MKCKPYSEITVEIRTQLKTVKITSNIFAVYDYMYYARVAAALCASQRLPRVPQRQGYPHPFLLLFLLLLFDEKVE